MRGKERDEVVGALVKPGEVVREQWVNLVPLPVEFREVMFDPI